MMATFDSAVSAQILRQSQFNEASLNEYSTKSPCSFLTQFSDANTLLCAKEDYHANKNHQKISSKKFSFTAGPDKIFLAFQTAISIMCRYT